MSVASDDKIEAVGRVLNDRSRPLKERFRGLFTLRNIGGPVAIRCIQQCFSDPSALLKHELAYCLGQMQDDKAIPVLKRILSDRNQEPMVRHEAGVLVFVFRSLIFSYPPYCGPGYRNLYSDLLRAGRSGGRTLVGARISAPFQTGLRAHPTVCQLVAGRLSLGLSGWGVALTTYHHLVPRLKNE